MAALPRPAGSPRASHTAAASTPHTSHAMHTPLTDATRTSRPSNEHTPVPQQQQQQQQQHHHRVPLHGIPSHVSHVSRSYSSPIVSAARAQQTVGYAQPAGVHSRTPYHSHTVTLATRASSLTPGALHELHLSLQHVLPLCRLPVATLAQLLSSSAAHPSHPHADAVHAAMHICATPRGGGGGAFERDGSGGRGGGSLQRLLVGLLFVLEQACSSTGDSTAIFGSSAAPQHSILRSALLALHPLAQQPPLRPLLLSAGALRIVSRVALDAWTRADDPTAPAPRHPTVPSAAPPAQSQMLSRALLVLLALTDAPTPSASNTPAAHPPVVYALVNKLGAVIIAGPDAADGTSSSSSGASALRDAAGEGDDPAASSPPPSPTFLLSLALLGNLVSGSAQLLAFVKSNPVAAGSSSNKSTATTTMAAATNTATSSSPHAGVSSTILLKPLYRQLVSSLSSAHLPLLTHSLRLVAQLAVGDPLVEGKLFNPARMDQTFQLVLNLILQAVEAAAAVTATEARSGGETGEGVSAVEQGGGQLLRPALDILTTLMRSQTLLKALCQYEPLPSTLQQLLRLLGPGSVTKNNRTASSPSRPASSSPSSPSPSLAPSALSLPLLGLFHALSLHADLRSLLASALREDDGADLLLSAWAQVRFGDHYGNEGGVAVGASLDSGGMPWPLNDSVRDADPDRDAHDSRLRDELSRSRQRERELQRRVADAEARIAAEQARHDEEMQGEQTEHEEQMERMRARLAEQEQLAAAQQSHAADRIAELDSELALSLSRATTLEHSLQESQSRSAGLAERLAQAGSAYEAQCAYGQRLAAENVALRTEAEAQLAGLEKRLDVNQQQLVESQRSGAEVSLRLEDAYAKLLLLDRALQEAEERASSHARQAQQHAQAAKQFAADLSALQVAEARTREQLAQRTAEAGRLASALEAAHAQREQLEGRLHATESQLAQVVRSEREGQARCAQLESGVQQARSRIAVLEQQVSEGARAAAEQARRLESAEAELRQHAQLAAMIHKLSGQASMQAGGAHGPQSSARG